MTHYVLLLVESAISENAWIGYHFKATHEFEHIVPILPEFKDGVIPPFEDVHKLFKDENSGFERIEKWSKEQFIGWTIEEFIIGKGGALTAFFFNSSGHFLKLHKLFIDITKVASIKS